MFDPTNSGRDRSGALNKVRNTLFRLGRQVETDLITSVHKYEKAEGDRDTVLVALGAAKNYVNMRRGLTPDVASDRLTDELSGRTQAIERKLEIGSKAK